MSSTSAHRSAASAFVVCVCLAALLTWLVVTRSPALLHFDVNVTAAVRSWADAAGWPVTLSDWIGRATAPFWSVLAALGISGALYASGRIPAAKLLALSAILGVLVTETVKRTVSRTRPPAAALHREDMTRSFPSGHTTAGIYLYCVAGYILIRIAADRRRPWLRLIGWFLLIPGPLIGVSRVILGVHWPSDVLAGWAYGSAVALAAALLLWSQLSGSWTAPGGEPAASDNAGDPIASSPEP
jgi:membrane-associated phospholipid phosphatase